MKKSFNFLLLPIIILALLTGCKDDSLSQKAIDQGKLALANSEYDKALASFELALDEGSKDKEVEKIIKIIKDFKEAGRLIELGEIDEAEEVLEGIDEDYKDYSIRIDIDALKEELIYLADGGIDEDEDQEVDEEVVDKAEEEEEIEDEEDTRPVFTRFNEYFNERFEFSLVHPNFWEYRESDNGDGISFFPEDDDINIVAYASHYMEDVSSPYENEKNLDMLQRTLDSGLEVTIFQGAVEDKYVIEMVYLDSLDIEYHFLLETSRDFYEENKQIIDVMINSFTVNDINYG